MGWDRLDHRGEPTVNPADPNRPVATASPFEFRLIMHVDDAGQARMLQKVLLMFKLGRRSRTPPIPTSMSLINPGALRTDDALIPRFSGATLRDGQPVARRLSSPAFGFTTPIAFLGAGEFGAGILSCEVAMGYDDPSNPFKHVYHPEHDNLNDRFESKVPEGIESFTVTRRVELEFTPEDPDRLAIAGWGDNQLGGIYRETVTGLQQRHSYPGHVSADAGLPDRCVERRSLT